MAPYLRGFNLVHHLLYPKLHHFFATKNHSTLSSSFFIRYLHFPRHCGCIWSLKKLHSILVTNGKITHPSAPVEVGELIRSYIHLGHPESAILVYHSVQKPNLALMNLTIRCLSDHELYGDLLSFYARLHRASPSCHSDNYTFPFVIKSSASVSAPILGKELHCRIFRTGYDTNVVVQTSLMDMYAKTGLVKDFLRVFDGMSQRDLISWNAFLTGCSVNELNEEAFEGFKRIFKCGLAPNATTFVSVIPVCTRLGFMGTGRSLHGLLYKTGTICTQSLIPALISMYATCGDLAAAEVLFESMSDKDIIPWNAIISVYAQNGKHDEAFEFFQKMQHESMNPNLITLVCILPACVNLTNSRLGGESVHTFGIKLGFLNKVAFITCLLSMYAKLGDSDTAQFLFSALSEKNLLSWNSIISGFVFNGRCCKALETFWEMQLTNVTPDSISMISVLSACSKLHHLDSGRSAHGFILRQGFESNPNLMNGLMTMYISCQRLSISLDLFDKMADKNLSCWNTLISGSVQLGNSKTSIGLFNQMMRTESITFDIVTMISILPVFNGVEDLATGMSFHGHGIKIGYTLDSSLANALISMYMKCNDLGSGYSLFDGLFLKDKVSWNVVMAGFRTHGFDNEVIVLFNQMMGLRSSGVRPNSITFLNILPICKTQISGRSIHAYAMRNFAMPEESLVLLTSMMTMYSRFQNLHSCLALFQMADKTNVGLWNTMMSVYITGNHTERAVDCFKEMVGFDVQPDDITVLNLISACAHIGNIDLAMAVTAYVTKIAFDKTTSISNSMINMYAKSGSIVKSRKVFELMVKKDPVSWSSMINGYGLHGDGGTALALFTEMKNSNVELDHVSYLTVLSACNHAGLVEDGARIFQSMVEEEARCSKVGPKMEHFSCMVGLLGRSGRVEEAYDLVRRNPFEVSRSMVESLLGACRLYGNVDVGEEILRWYEGIDGSGSSSEFVVLSNVYAGVGRWDDCWRIRCDMDGRGLWKQPGFSLVS